MSLRSHTDQVFYETAPAREAWSLSVIDACRAAGCEPPTDLYWRWQAGETVGDILRELRVTPTAQRKVA